MNRTMTGCCGSTEHAVLKEEWVDIRMLRHNVAVPPNIHPREVWVNTHLLEGSIIKLRCDGAVPPIIGSREEGVRTRLWKVRHAKY